MWDTQHAVLFCQSLCMSAFELRCTLPCDQALWEADSAETWQKLRRMQGTQPLFLSVLKSHIGSQIPAPARKLNGLSRVLLLHGLMSIAWDMNRRDQTSLGALMFDEYLLDELTVSHRCGWEQHTRRLEATYCLSLRQLESRLRRLHHVCHSKPFSGFLFHDIGRTARCKKRLCYLCHR